MTESQDRRPVLSALWLFVILNYLHGDVAMVIFRPAAYQAIAARMSDGLILGAAVLMELLIAMVLLSRVLRYPANRWTNIGGGVVATVFAAATLSPRAPAFYMFLSLVEILCTLFIVWYAWTWRPHQSDSRLGEVRLRSVGTLGAA